MLIYQLLYCNDRVFLNVFQTIDFFFSFTGSTGGSGVYPGSGSQATGSYQNSASQNVNYQGAAVAGSNYSGTAGAGPGGSSSYQSGSTSFHSGNQPSVFTSQNYNNSGVNTYGSQLPDGSTAGADSVQSSQPARAKTQRARVPPPSKVVKPYSAGHERIVGVISFEFNVFYFLIFLDTAKCCRNA